MDLNGNGEMCIGNMYFKAKETAFLTLHQIYENRAHTADVHFEFEENGELITIPAHKNILANGSLVFHDMFFGRDRIPQGNINTRSDCVKSDTFKTFLALFYGKWSLITAQNCAELLRVSQDFEAKCCEEACNEFAKLLDLTSETIDK